MGDPQPGKRASQPPGVVDQHTFAGRQQGSQAHVDPDWAACGDRLPFGLRQFHHQAHIPPVIGALDDHMLDEGSLRDSSVVDQLDLTDVLQVETHLTIVLHAQFAAIPIAVFDTLEAVMSFEARKAGGLACLHSAEEGGEGFVQSAQQLLDAGGIQHPVHLWVVVALIAEVCPLIRVADPLAGFLVGGDALFQGGVVQLASLPEQAVEGCDLRSVGTQAVLVGTDHLATSLLSFYVLLDRIFRNMPDTPHIVRSAPKARLLSAHVRKLLTENSRSIPLELIRKLLWGFGWISSDKQVNVIGHDLERFNIYIQLACFFLEQFSQAHSHITHQYLPSILWTPNQMIFERKYTTRARFVLNIHHRTIVLQNIRNDNCETNQVSGSRHYQIPLSPLEIFME